MGIMRTERLASGNYLHIVRARERGPGGVRYAVRLVETTDGRYRAFNCGNVIRIVDEQRNCYALRPRARRHIHGVAVAFHRQIDDMLAQQGAAGGSMS